MRGALLGLAAIAGCSFQAAAFDDAPAIDAHVSACADGFCKRKAITIPAANVSGGPLGDFPVLIALATDSDLAAGARTDGGDIRFTAADGSTILAYDREHYDASTGHLLAWVNVPTLASTADTQLYMYWGNATAPDQQDPTHAWNGGFQGVWHLDDSTATTTIVDASGSHNDGVIHPGVVLQTGAQIGDGAAFDGMMGYAQLAPSSSLSSTSAAGTIGMWINFVNSANTHYQYILTSSATFATRADGYSWAQQAGGSNYFYPWAGNTNDFNLAANPFAAGGWHYAVVTLDYASKSVAIYVDGVVLQLTTTNVPMQWTMQAIPAGWYWGGNPAAMPGNAFAGAMDEIHVANVVRTPDWIATEYRNQSAPTTFSSLGAFEQLTP